MINHNINNHFQTGLPAKPDMRNTEPSNTLGHRTVKKTECLGVHRSFTNMLTVTLPANLSDQLREDVRFALSTFWPLIQRDETLSFARLASRIATHYDLTNPRTRYLVHKLQALPA